MTKPVSWSKNSFDNHRSLHPSERVGYLNTAIGIASCRGPILNYEREDIEKAVRVLIAGNLPLLAGTAMDRLAIEVRQTEKQADFDVVSLAS